LAERLATLAALLAALIKLMVSAGIRLRLTNSDKWACSG
jgi:hypothetical protein